MDLEPTVQKLVIRKGPEISKLVENGVDFQKIIDLKSNPGLQKYVMMRASDLSTLLLVLADNNADRGAYFQQIIALEPDLRNRVIENALVAASVIEQGTSFPTILASPDSYLL